MVVAEPLELQGFNVFPRDWHAHTLGDICLIRAAGDLDKATFSLIQDKEHPFPIYSNAKNNDGLYGYSSRYQYEGNKVTVTGRGDIGHAVYRSTEFSAIGRLLILTPQKVCDPRFLTYYLNHCTSFVIESTGVPQLTAPQLALHTVFIPSILAEQEAISQALGDADAHIDSLERLLAKKRAIMHATMQELLTGKRRLPGFNNPWNLKRLGDTALLKARIGWQGLTTAEYLDSGHYCLVTGTDFKSGRIDWSNCHYVDHQRYIQDRYIQLTEGDVLVTKDGTIGKVAFVDYLPLSATLNSGVFVIRPLHGAFHPEFLFYVLRSRVFESFLSQLSAGSTINHLYQKDFVDFVFSAPPTIQEQREIASILADMEAEVRQVEAKIMKARDIKQGMMQELLTGKVRLV